MAIYDGGGIERTLVVDLASTEGRLRSCGNEGKDKRHGRSVFL